MKKVILQYRNTKARITVPKFIGLLALRFTQLSPYVLLALAIVGLAQTHGKKIYQNLEQSLEKQFGTYEKIYKVKLIESALANDARS